MFEQVFKNVDDVLRKEAGCTTELDYTEQTSWLLFLKYLDVNPCSINNGGCDGSCVYGAFGTSTSYECGP